MNEDIRLILLKQKDSSDENSEEFSVMDKINYQLITELSNNVLSLPEMVIQKIRQIVYRNGFELPKISKLDTMGDELIVEMDQNEHRIHGKVSDSLYLYLIYYLTDDKTYDVFAEIIDKKEMEEILKSVDMDEDEDDTED
jgi:hypothetical protein